MAIVLSFGKLAEGFLVRTRYKKFVKLKISLERLNQMRFKTNVRGTTIRVSESSISHSMIYSLRAFTTDLKVFEQIIVNAEYAFITDIVKDYEVENPIKFIVDAGANIGLTSLFLLTNFPKSYVIAIEPDKENFQQLRQNLILNGFFSRCLPLLKALWRNSTDRITINNDFRDGGHWSRSISVTEKSDLEFRAFPITLEEVVQLNKDESLIDLLKLDIEGGEFILFDSYFFKKTLEQK